MDNHRIYLRYAFAALLVVPFACSDKNDHPGDARVLDVACSKVTTDADLGALPPDSGCQLSKVGAKKVTGLTSDSIGLRLGPDPGEVTIVVPPLSLPNSDDSWTYEILARGTGTFDVPSCFTTTTPAETGAEPVRDTGTCITAGSPTNTFEWIAVGAEGRLDRSTSGRMTTRTPVTLRVKAGSTLEIVDIRIVSSETPKGCGS
ncbi:MAG: hypothetical protein ABI175_05320 [Polyangiales bacterium]